MTVLSRNQLCDPVDPTRLFCPWDSPGKITGELLCPPPGDLPNPETEPTSPALAGGFFTTAPPGKAGKVNMIRQNVLCALCAGQILSAGEE